MVDLFVAKVHPPAWVTQKDAILSPRGAALAAKARSRPTQLDARARRDSTVARAQRTTLYQNDRPNKTHGYSAYVSKDP
jgi:hypothetical protein